MKLDDELTVTEITQSMYIMEHEGELVGQVLLWNRDYYCIFWVEIKCQLDATEVLIADLIACSTCFGHHYAHHQELKSIIQWFKHSEYVWCDFDRASSLICGNKMPTRCNRGFYCRSYWMLNMFWAPLRPSSGAQEYYTVVHTLRICLMWFSPCIVVNMWK